MSLALFAGDALASGGYGGPLPERSGSVPHREVDRVYEFGKALYQGRGGAQKTAYCVKAPEAEGSDSDKVKRIGRRSLRAWRGSDQNRFANALVDCAAPDQLALRSVDEQQIPFVLYYLNKRYKLDLTAGGE
ncbi:MAG: hypothetical protein AAF515_14505 [Pseudomonadota bacterium]